MKKAKVSSKQLKKACDEARQRVSGYSREQRSELYKRVMASLLSEDSNKIPDQAMKYGVALAKKLGVKRTPKQSP